ncbi:MAG TPA: enoyl-CoA hydratase-related protein [Acetobacteraceae bacterium]|nr:enoyl-CoA hydratase-related protein [Acetobacteraceae bacterium]
MKLHSILPDPAFETLALSEAGEAILVVTLNRPHVANAINTRMGEELVRVFSALEVDPALYRCIVLTGAGDRVFCGGADLKERDGMTDDDFARQHYLFERMIRALVDCMVPLICAANGSAVAGGLELLLACDFAYASRAAVFGFTEVSRGIMPGGGGTQQLPRSIGIRRAKELIFRGARIDAAEAESWGLVNRLCEPGKVLAETIAAAEEICANAPLSVSQAKKALNLGQQMDLRTGLFMEIEAYNRLIPSEDRQEGIAAYNQKRKPVFRGR